MSKIIHYTQNFIKGIQSDEVDVPIPIQIALSIGAAILLTITIVILRPILRTTRVRNAYMWYYYIGIFNLINISVMLWFYYRKTTKGDLIGEEGEAGQTGPKGSSGTAANCSLCATNLYIQPVKENIPIVELNLTDLTSASLGPQLPDAVNQLAASTSHTLFDYSDMVQQLLIGSSNNNTSLDQIQNIAENSEYVLLSYLNSTQGQTTETNNPTIYRTNLASGTIGYLAMGDSISRSNKIQPQSQVINGDIRATDTAGYDIRGIITIIHNKTLTPGTTTPKAQEYQILKPRLLKQSDKNDTSSSVSTYDTLGEIMIPVGKQPPKLHYALVATPCLEPLSSTNLQLVSIYPLNDGTGYISFWDTGFGTFHTQRANIPTINLDNTSERKQLYTLISPMNTQDNKHIQRLTQYLASINIPQYVSAAAILGHTIEYTQFHIGEILQQHWPVISASITPSQLQQLQQFKNSPATTINPTNIPHILSIIGNIITNPTQINTKQTNRSETTRKTTIKSLYELRSKGNDLSTPEEKQHMAKYSLAQDYEKMRTLISDAGIQIENVGSLLDLVLVLVGLRTDGDLSSNVYMADLSPTSIRVLTICAALIAPTHRVFRPKDSCLISASLDMNRISAITALQQAMNEYNIILKNIKDSTKSNISNEMKKQLSYINQLTENTFEKLATILGTVPRYMHKLQTGDFEEFSTRRIQETTQIFQKLNNDLTI